MIYNKEGKLVIKSWCNNLEEQAILQAINLANHPFAFHHIALMPDAHMGYGMPIGGVLATKGVIIPNAVGVDIGCGMLAVKTSLTKLDQKTLKKIMGEIRNSVPVGFAHHEMPRDEYYMPETYGFGVDLEEQCPVAYSQYDKALYQLGTLGGGNHFIEIQKGSDGHIWYMIHSGSRNFGLQIAKHYNSLAKELNKKWVSAVPAGHDLAFLPLDTDEGQAYLREMQYACDFAQENRNRMAAAIESAFNRRVECSFDDAINIHHNYAQLEHHFGQNVMVHRKGATSAKEGQLGIIPGSQGTASYIVKGKGNPESFQSCSHGAGRKMGRKQAQKNLDLEWEKKRLDRQNIVHSIRHKTDLDEAAGAYKNIDVVMEEQQDLVDIVVKLQPLGVIKG